MKAITTELSDVFILEPRIFKDDRGYFYESYNALSFSKLGIDNNFVQDNQSKSEYGVIRGLHFQKGEFAQAKLIKVLEGEIFDVAVDIRQKSPTFGKWMGVKLSSENHLQLFIPKGFAHGFAVLSETAIVSYKCDEYYNPQSEGGIIYNDYTLGINWQIPHKKEIISAKDSSLPSFELLSKSINFAP